MTRLRVTDISPDGVRIIVDWERFTPGASIFIPAINTNKAIRHILKAAKLQKSQIKYRVTIENEKYGVRVWRLM